MTMNGKDPFDVFLTRFIRLTSALLGFAIMGYEALKDKLDRPYVIAAALAMIGPSFAKSITQLFASLGKLLEVTLKTEDKAQDRFDRENDTQRTRNRKRADDDKE
jgi:hypothetical protein